MPETSVLTRYGLLLVFANVLLDQGGVPLPAVPLLLACGALAAKGEISLALLLITATLASLTADSAWFTLGRWQGRRVLKTFRSFSMRLDEHLTHVERSLNHHGLVAVALAKFVPGLQTVAPPLAGALGISIGRFLVVSFLTGLVWTCGIVGIGAMFRDSIYEATRWTETMGGWALVLIGVLLAGYATFVWRRRLRGSSAPPAHRRRSAGGKPEPGKPGSQGQAPPLLSTAATEASERLRPLGPSRRTS